MRAIDNLAHHDERRRVRFHDARRAYCGGHAHVLFEAPSIWVLDWQCSGEDSAREEPTNPHFEISIARRGIYEREYRGYRTVGDASVATFWDPGETFRVRHPLGGGDACTILRFPEQTFRELMAGVSRPDESAYPRFQAHHVPISGRHFADLRRLLDRGRQSASAVELEERAIEIAGQLIREMAEGQTAPVRLDRSMSTAREYARRVRELVGSRFLEPLTLSQIAREVCCSPFHLSRMVVAVEGLRIHELIVKLRLREGLRRLLDTRDPIATIATQTGFSSQSHFGAAFKREFGATPRKLRTGRN